MVTVDDTAAAAQVLTLRGSVTHVAELGTASAFRFEVTEGDGPVPSGSTQTLTVLPSDVDQRAELLAHQDPERVSATFSRLRDGEEYRTIGITGFVDATYTSWQLDSVLTEVG